MTYASIWKFGGAVQRVAADATAFGDRSMPCMLSLDAIWSNTDDDDANISWVRDVWRDMQRHSTGRMYLNFPGLGRATISFGMHTVRKPMHGFRKSKGLMILITCST
nr:hypothetical protein [Phyllobacterium sp. KW56]